MHQIDELHMELPFAGSRMLQCLLVQAEFKVGRLHVATLLKRMGIEALCRRPNTSKPASASLSKYSFRFARYLQPFADVNKRVSRLGANIPLIKHNLSPLSFIDMPEETYFRGTQGVYEFNRTELLADVYLAAYERSCQRYAVLVKSLPEPDPLRLRYRDEIRAMVRSIVVEGTAHLADHLPVDTDPATRAGIQAIVDAEVANLHEGNALRFGIRRSAFEVWRRQSDGR